MYDLYFLVFRINNLLQTKRKQLPQLPCEIWQSSESGCRATKEINIEKTKLRIQIHFIKICKIILSSIANGKEASTRCSNDPVTYHHLVSCVSSIDFLSTNNTWNFQAFTMNSLDFRFQLFKVSAAWVQVRCWFIGRQRNYTSSTKDSGK